MRDRMSDDLYGCLQRRTGVGQGFGVIGALTLYFEKNLDFADAVLAIKALRKGPEMIYSFDRHLNRVDGLKRLEPSLRSS